MDERKPCAACPRSADRQATCPAITIGHARYCQLVDPEGPDYRPAYIPLVRDWEPPGATTGKAAGIRSALELVQSCDYRTDALDECSCTARRHCGLGKGQFATEPHAVTLADCLKCVAG